MRRACSFRPPFPGQAAAISAALAAFACIFLPGAATDQPPAKAPDVFVSTDATTNMSCSGGVCTPTAARAILNVNELTRRLVDGSVTIATIS